MHAESHNPQEHTGNCAPLERKQAFVYILKCGRFVKVGHAFDVGERLAALRIGNPYPITVARTYGPGKDRWAYHVEVRAHMALRDHAHSGEWFACGVRVADQAVKAVIRRLNGEPDGAVYSPASRLARFLATYDCAT